MTRIWMSGLEAGSLNVFSSVYVIPQITAAQARTGTYSLYIDAIYERVVVPLGMQATSELFIRTGLYYTGGNGVFDRTFLMLYSLSGYLLTFQVRAADNVILVRLGGSMGALIASGGVVPTNDWCCIEVHVLIDNAIGIVQVRLDGVQIIDFLGDTQYGTEIIVYAISWGSTPETGVPSLRCGYCYYDDLAVNNPHGIRNNSWPGLGGIIGLVPTGTGNYTQLTPSAGTNWQAVNDVPPDDDAAYVEQATVDLKDTYQMQDLIITPGKVADIAAVQWLCRAYNTVSQGGNFARLLRLYGVDYQDDDIGYDRSYDYHPEILETSPDTGQDWTGDEVNALEAGVVVK